MTSREEQLGAKSTNDLITTNINKGAIVVDDIEMQKQPIDTGLPITPTSSLPTTCDKEIEGKRKRTSVVWLHFKRKKIGGVKKTICNYCEKLLRGGRRNGTRHLHDHFKHCLLRQQRDIKQSLLNLSKNSQEKDEFDLEVLRKKKN